MARGQRTGGRGGYGRREVRVLKRWKAREMGGKYISLSKKRLRVEGKKKEARTRNASDGGWEFWNRCPLPYLCGTIGRSHVLV